MLKRLLLTLIVVLGLSSCYVEEVHAQTVPIQYGCAVYEDPAGGEIEVCNVHYYVVPTGVVYYEPRFNIWVGNGVYWHQGIWYRGYHPAWYSYYRPYYRPFGYYRGYTRGYYGAYHYYHGYYGGGGTRVYYRGGGRFHR